MSEERYIQPENYEAVIELYKNKITFPCKMEMRFDWEHPDLIIEVDSKDYSAAIEQIYSDEFLAFRNSITDRYGYFNFAVHKNIDDNLTDVKVGDLVLVDNPLTTIPSLVVVSSKNVRDGKVQFGCSYITVNVINDVYEPKITMSDERYGGYESGFQKKVTVEEAIVIIKQMVDESYQAALQRIEDNKQRAEDALRVFEKMISDGVGIEHKESAVFKIPFSMDFVCKHTHEEIVD